MGVAALSFRSAVGVGARQGHSSAARTRENAPEAEWAPPSWDEVVREHSGRVYRLAYRLTGNQHDAEDLTQEVFVRVFRSLANYTPGTFEGWLHRITTNLFLDQARRKQRIRFEGLADDAAERIQGREPTPAQVYDDTNFDADVQAALDDLAPDYRAAVVLCDIEGLSYEEISATLGVKLGTVRSRIHRGRAQLREALDHRAPTRAARARGTSSSRSGRRRPRETPRSRSSTPARSRRRPARPSPPHRTRGRTGASPRRSTGRRARKRTGARSRAARDLTEQTREPRELSGGTSDRPGRR
nr:RNA polymerase sigma factor SigE [Actinomadura sp. CNU-125]